MKQLQSIALILFTAFSAFSTSSFALPALEPKDVTVIDLWSNIRELGKFFGPDKKALVLIFLKSECPIARVLAPELVQLENKYRAQGIQFVAVFPNSGETLNKIGMYGLEHEVPFPLVKDRKNHLADLLEVKRTPEVVVLSPSWNVLYRGLVNDQFWAGGRKAAPENLYLASALESITSGTPIAINKTTPAGCLLERYSELAKDSSVTYAKDIAPILHERCVSCHREGGIAPFSLETWDDVQGNVSMMEEVLELERMPPWFGVMDEAKRGGFSNDKRLSPTETRLLKTWFASGAPSGKLSDTPKFPPFQSEWSIGKPDIIIEMKEPFKVPASGEVEYQFISQDLNLPKGVWVQAAQVLPGKPQVVHHINVHISESPYTPSSTEEMNLFRLFGLTGSKASLLASFIPGDAARHYPDDHGVYIPEGGSIVFENHYTPNGVATEDRSRVGLILAKTPPKHRIRSHLLIQRKIDIPAGDPMVKSEKSVTFDDGAKLMSVRPHMHKLGKHIKYELITPDGKTETILSIPRWDFNWQSIYEFKNPIVIPPGSDIKVTAYWDNSSLNPNNPVSPPVDVGWGLQTQFEMLNGGLTFVSLKDQDDAP